MQPHVSLAIATAGVLIFLTACTDNQPSCLQTSREEAIKLAIRAKPDPDRIGNQDQPKWASDKIQDVELRNIRDPASIVAVVHFQGDGARAPLALVYGDCEVGWSEEDVQR